MPQKVLFKHCDPAGIVFYPRYFEMIIDCVETFFDAQLRAPFEILLRDGGMPTIEISARFYAPSRHGDMLALAVSPDRLGRSSFPLTVTATCETEVRFAARSTLVDVDAKGCAAPSPDHVRTPLEYITGETE